jgi:very-short-patch-repair endonuclease
MPRKLTYKEVKDIIEENGEYTLLSKEYLNNRQHLLIRHNCNKCNNNIFERSLYVFQAGKKCHKCAIINRTKLKTKTTEEFKDDIKRIFNDEMEVIGDYKNNKTKILMYSRKCGHYFEGYPINLLKGCGCNICTIRSKGNEKIDSILNELNINHKSEYKFEDCKYKRTLSFDFYLEDYNICIEYDGEQHYSKNTFRYGEKFEEQQKRDNIKNNYCKTNNIKLIRIPYTEFDNIENILKENIKGEK